MSFRNLARLVAALAVASSCHGATKPALGPPPRLPDAKRVRHAPPPPEWFWEPAYAHLREDPVRIALPLTDNVIVRVEDAARIWDEIGEEGREHLRRDGLVAFAPSSATAQAPATNVATPIAIPTATATPTATAPPGPARIGAFYMHLRDARVPYVITLDALFFAVHAAFAASLADVEQATLIPALRSLLARLGAELAAEQRGASVEVGEALRVARVVVAVASALMDRSPQTKIDQDIAPLVQSELASIDAHAGPKPSAALGLAIDYARFDPPAGAASPGAYRALAWLAAAPLALAASGGADAPPATAIRGARSTAPAEDIAIARTHTRVALILARLVDREVDPSKHDAHDVSDAHDAYARVASLLALAYGAPDDVSLADVADAAAAAGIDPKNPAHVADVTRIDKLRRRIAATRAAHAYDGSGARDPIGRPASSVRVLGAAAPADTILLAALAGPAIGHGADGSTRLLPCPLDLAAWLGGEEGHAALHESGRDAYDGFPPALARTIAALPPPSDDALHGSIHGSTLAALGAWLGDPGAHGKTPAAARASIESALAAWTWLRHDGRALSRPAPLRAGSEPRVLRVTGAPLAAFVEPSPDVIAPLVGVVHQMQRGFGSLAARANANATANATAQSAAPSPSAIYVAEIEDLLATALRIAEKEVNDEAFAEEDFRALAAMPARLAAIEADAETLGVSVATAEPIAIARARHDDRDHDHDLDHDHAQKTRRFATSVAGAIEPIAIAAREPLTGRVVLAVGAHVTHHIFEEDKAVTATDLLPGDLPRESYVAAFRVGAFPRRSASTPAPQNTP